VGRDDIESGDVSTVGDIRQRGRAIVTTVPLTVEHVAAAPARTTEAPAIAVPVRPPSMHIPSLDGLRAVSFFIVFVAHSGLQWFVPGGFGVTVFFFLSGFLITTLIRVEQQTTGTISVRNFYLRRALRILPPFYLILAFATLLTVVRVSPGQLQAKPLLAQLFHFSNYWFIFHGSDGTPAGTVPYWSLAVEEHFYLVFPVLYIILSRYLSRRGQAWSLLAICALVCAWRFVLVLGFHTGVDRTYMGSDTRFDSILFGCVLAIAMNPMLDAPKGSARLWQQGLVPAGLALLLVTFGYRAPWFRETLRYTLQGIALTPIFVAAMRFPDWLPFRILNQRAVAFVGVLSYTLYLIHQIILMALQHVAPSLSELTMALIALAISMIVALLIHRFIEEPCARLRKRLARGAPVGRAAVAVR